MKNKLGNMTYSQWLKYNERLLKKQSIDRANRIGARQRFIDANLERRKIYRRSTARLIARMCNPLLTKFCGGYIQKAKVRITVHTSVGTKVILQRSQRFGDFKPLNKSFSNLSLEQTQIEWKEVFEEYKKHFPDRIEKVIMKIHCLKIFGSLQRY